MVMTIWNTIIGQIEFPVGATIVNLLWSSSFLKTNDMEQNITGFFGVDEKTYPVTFFLSNLPSDS
jgi:hypothetical protein